MKPSWALALMSESSLHAIILLIKSPYVKRFSLGHQRGPTKDGQVMWKAGDLKIGIGVPASTGAVVGVLAGIGWRYTVPRTTVDANPPPLPPGTEVYLIRVNYYEYVGGPSWLPTLFLAVIGLMLGVTTGLAGIAIRRTENGPVLRSDATLTVSAAALAGALTGLWGAAVAHWAPPSIAVLNATGQRPDNYDAGAGYSGLPRSTVLLGGRPSMVVVPPRGNCDRSGGGL